MALRVKKSEEPMRKPQPFPKSTPVSSTPRILLRMQSGAHMHEQPFSAAQRVVREGALVLDESRQPVTPKKVVICRRSVQGHLAQTQTRFGVAVDVIDPGKEHNEYIVPGSSVWNPTVFKGHTRTLGKCSDTGHDACRGCHNAS